LYLIFLKNAIGDKEVILKVNRRRFKCINCQKPFSESIDFVDKKKSFTHRYAETITKQVTALCLTIRYNSRGGKKEKNETLLPRYASKDR
jgi:hypothetical protein